MGILDIYREGGEEAVIDYLTDAGADSEEIQEALMFCEDFADDPEDDCDD